jgi:hypothetical protein
MRTDGLAKAFTAGGSIPARTIVKPHSVAGQVVAGAAAADKIIGVSTEVAASSGDRVDVFLSGVAEVVYAGNVAAGDPITSDSTGKAVVAAPAAGVNARIIGFALTAGVANDIGAVFLAPGLIQGA